MTGRTVVESNVDFLAGAVGAAFVFGCVGDFSSSTVEGAVAALFKGLETGSFDGVRIVAGVESSATETESWDDWMSS